MLLTLGSEAQPPGAVLLAAGPAVEHGGATAPVLASPLSCRRESADILFLCLVPLTCKVQQTCKSCLVHQRAHLTQPMKALRGWHLLEFRDSPGR